MGIRIVKVEPIEKSKAYVEIINSIKKDYAEERQDSKAPTFALTFAGTYITLMKNCGFSESEARRIEDSYHALYKVSTAWVDGKLRQASQDGYVTLAFGVRLRTPILKQVVWGTGSMPYEAAAEGRTAGNAASGQSYGSLTMRAANEFMQRVRNSPYKYDIKLCALIHDAIYPLIRNKLGIVKWVNDNLIECMEWQELPELAHDKVKLNAELDLFNAGWHKPITLKNRLTKQQIIDNCKE